MGILVILVMFVLALFGLTANAMLMKKYNDANDKTSTGYKFTIFNLIFFIFALIGVIAYAFMGSKSSAPQVSGANGGVRAANVAAAPPKQTGFVNKIADKLVTGY